MEFTISSIFFTSDYSSFLVAITATLFCIVFATVLVIKKARKLRVTPYELDNLNPGDCAGGKISELVNGNSSHEQTGASMIEEMVPELTSYILSYLDYMSLCRLSMTSSLMRIAANDDDIWKKLYQKEFTLEPDNVRPANGWKAYYAATKALVDADAEFFRIIRKRSLPDMRRFWLDANYIECFHGTPLSGSGYNEVMEYWEAIFIQNEIFDFRIKNVKTRVMTDIAWVSIIGYDDNDGLPYNVTNIYKFHNNRWYMVHHHY